MVDGDGDSGDECGMGAGGPGEEGWEVAELCRWEMSRAGLLLVIGPGDSWMILVEGETQDIGACVWELCLGLAPDWRLDWPETCAEHTRPSSKVGKRGLTQQDSAGWPTRDGSRVHVIASRVQPESSSAFLCLSLPPRQTAWGVAGNERTIKSSTDHYPAPPHAPQLPPSVSPTVTGWQLPSHFRPSSSLRSQSPPDSQLSTSRFFPPSAKGLQVPV